MSSQQQPCSATTCTRELRDTELDAGQRLCTPCLHLLEAWLTELPTQITVLEGMRQRETTGGHGGGSHSGPLTAPLPGNPHVLNLLGPAAWCDGVRDPYRQAHEDQHGPLPIAGTLIVWVRVITEARRWNPPQVLTPRTLAAWLNRTTILDWAARQDWAGPMHYELQQLIRLVRRTTHVRPQRRPLTQPCPRCDSLALVETDHQLYVDCSVCESMFSRDELALAARIQLAQLHTPESAVNAA